MITQKLNQYLEENLSEEPELLKKLNRETHVKVLRPRMLSGHLQGRLLSMISHMIRPERILEIGTFTGYSALCLAEGLRENGLIYTLEASAELLVIARSYFEASAYASQIISLQGQALELMETLDPVFDLIFIDADKRSNLSYYEKSLDLLSPGGFILIDNVLWDGKVLTNQTDKDTVDIHELNHYISQDNRVENLIIPLRDGLHLVRKK